MQFDCVVVGAGLSGLICARELQQSGLKVLIVEKSRGVGGRVATRRIEGTGVDHGLPYLESQGEQSAKLITQLCEHQIILPWQGQVGELSAKHILTLLPSQPRYIAPEGMTAIAKFLARDLEIVYGHLVTRLDIGSFWTLTGNFSEPIQARAVILAIPAPQTLMLLINSKIAQECYSELSAVNYQPRLSVLAGYHPSYPLPELPFSAVRLPDDPDVAWLALDSSKRQNPAYPVFLLHSSSQFAQIHLETPDLTEVGYQLLKKAEKLLLPGLSEPQWLQVHRWRYALPHHPFGQSYFSVNHSLPLVCCGDWCGGKLVESALTSGLAAAKYLLARGIQ